MASDQLRRKIRKKLGMSSPTPSTKPKSVFPSIQAQPVRTKGCCGRSK